MIDERILVPDQITPVVGWRSWKVTNDGLVSIIKPWRWAPRETSSAQCVGEMRRWNMAPGLFNPTPAPDPVPHFAPQERCVCGFYAAKERWRVTSYKGDVIGRIALWGKVIEYDGGWRAEKGYPQAFFTEYERGSDGRAVLERYGVPILSVSDLPEEAPPPCSVCKVPITGAPKYLTSREVACGVCWEEERRRHVEELQKTYYTSLSGLRQSMLVELAKPTKPKRWFWL